MGKPFRCGSVTEQPWCFGIVHDDTSGAIECVKPTSEHSYRHLDIDQKFWDRLKNKENCLNGIMIWQIWQQT